MKRYLVQILALIAATFTAAAQQVVGTVENFPSYSAPTQLIDTKDNVFVLSAKNLFAYHKDSNELQHYSTSNYLNDATISSIWYDFDKKYLLVVYSDYNIDLVFDSGRTVNVADLKDSTLTDKTINDVDFYDGKAYLATKFGMMVIDSETGVVVDSGNYGTEIKRIGIIKDRIFVVTGSGGYSAPRSGRHGQWSVFSKTDVYGNFTYGITQVSDNQLIGLYSDRVAYLVTYSDGKWSQSKVANYETPSGLRGYIYRTQDGGLVTQSNGKAMLYFNADGTYKGSYTPSGFDDQPLGDYNGTHATLWCADANGVGCYNTSTETYDVSRICPQGVSGSTVGCIREASDGSIYFMTQGISQGDFSSNATAYIDRLQNGTFSKVYSSTLMYSIMPEPTNPDNLVLATFYGVASYRNGVRKNYDKTNSSISTDASTPMVTAVDFDADENLYFFLNSGKTGVEHLHFVSKEAWQNGPTQSDFTPIDVACATTNHTSKVKCLSNGMIMYSGSHSRGIYDPKTGNSIETTYIVDEDGASPSASDWSYAMVEDKNGWVWLGLSGSVIVVKNPADMFNNNFTVYRPKVPRNDGTNLADYLLDLVTVTGISVDANNQKWFSTYGSGLYHTSADGSTILEHLTTENSDLPSNNLLAVHATESGDIYIGTDQGLSVYHSSSTVAAEDYSSVIAFPNPVTPDYTGWISITGLMDNSFVKITDAFGNAVYATTSSGGQIMWDGCDANGNRVKSGVYYVFASQTENGSSSAATKILVIN